jgi:hypothetical protein
MYICQNFCFTTILSRVIYYARKIYVSDTMVECKRFIYHRNTLRLELCEVSLTTVLFSRA